VPPQETLDQSSTWSILEGCNNAEALEEGRQIVEEALGEEKFLKAYAILKEHQELSEQQTVSRQEKDNFAFNKEVLRNKLDFLTDKEFKDYIVWMYTQLLIETEEMKKNFE
jgi:hypothetical protein